MIFPQINRYDHIVFVEYVQYDEWRQHYFVEWLCVHLRISMWYLNVTLHTLSPSHPPCCSRTSHWLVPVRKAIDDSSSQNVSPTLSPAWHVLLKVGQTFLPCSSSRMWAPARSKRGGAPRDSYPPSTALRAAWRAAHSASPLPTQTTAMITVTATDP